MAVEDAISNVAFIESYLCAARWATRIRQIACATADPSTVLPQSQRGRRAPRERSQSRSRSSTAQKRTPSQKNEPASVRGRDHQVHRDEKEVVVPAVGTVLTPEARVPDEKLPESGPGSSEAHPYRLPRTPDMAQIPRAEPTRPRGRQLVMDRIAAPSLPRSGARPQFGSKRSVPWHLSSFIERA